MIARVNETLDALPMRSLHARVTAGARTGAARVPAGTQHAGATDSNWKLWDFLNTRVVAERYSAKTAITQGLTLGKYS